MLYEAMLTNLDHYKVWRSISQQPCMDQLSSPNLEVPTTRETGLTSILAWRGVPVALGWILPIITQIDGPPAVSRQVCSQGAQHCLLQQLKPLLVARDADPDVIRLLHHPLQTLFPGLIC